MAAQTGVAASPRIRVLFCLDAFEGPSTGGTESQFWLLFNGLPRDVFEPEIVLLRRSEYLARNHADIPATVLGILSIASPLAWVKALRFALSASSPRPAVALLFLNDVSICLPPFLSLARVPVIVSRRDLGFWYTPRLLRALRLLRPCVDMVMANSAAVARAVADAEGYPQGKLRVVYNGFARPPRVAPKRSSPGPTGQLQLVLVANLKPIKRISDAIRAVAALAGKSIDARLSIVGGDGEALTGGSHLRELTRLVEELDLSDRVRFHGRQEDPSAAIEAADVCLLCSESEGLSNSIIEYMFAGKPTVCSDVGGNGELIEHGVSGLLYRPADIESLVRHLERFSNEPGLAHSMGERALQVATAKFTATATIGTVAGLLREMAA